MMPIYEGSALGMTIVKSLVKMTKRQIEVKSKRAGHGVYRLSDFERIDEFRLKQDVNRGKMTSIKGMRILLVEDHPLNAEIAIKILEKQGCAVDHAKDGAEGVAFFSNLKEINMRRY